MIRTIKPGLGNCISAVMFVALSCSVGAATLVPSPPQVDAKSFFLQDYSTGQVLAEKNPDERVEPASLTKMLTVYVALSEMKAGQLKFDDQVRISSAARAMGGSRMFLEVDSVVSVKDLLLGIIVQSGNDASVALAEFIAGDESAFASLMNQHAAKLGLTDSHFTNSSGLPEPEHYSTARDLSTIARALIRDFPEEYKWHALPSFAHNGIEQPNRNTLLSRDARVDGLKTGYTKNAGFCLVASGREDDMRLIAVVLNTDSARSRARHAQSLLSYGFRFYETRRVYKAQEPVTAIRVWKGVSESVNLGLHQDLYVTVPRGKYDDLQAQVELEPQVLAPVRVGQRKGRVTIRMDDKLIADRPLLALRPVAEGNLLRRVSDHVRLMFE